MSLVGWSKRLNVGLDQEVGVLKDVKIQLQNAFTCIVSLVQPFKMFFRV